MATDHADDDRLAPVKANAPASPPNSEASAADASVYPHASDEAKSATSVATDAYVAQMPHNMDQASQHGLTGALNPPRGQTLP